MKRHLILLSMTLILSACVVPPSETIRKEQCFNSHAFKIFQLNDDISLVKTIYCNWSENDTETARKCDGGASIQENIYAMDLHKEFTKNISESEWKKLSKDLYDGKVYILGEYCLMQDGNYTYYNTVGAKQTVIKVKTEKSQKPNPEYEKWKAEQDSKNVEENTDSKPKE